MGLSSGYAIALQIESPVSAIDTFLLAVILVMIGTYALFIGGSIIVLKALKKNKRLYYRNPNFITLSGMIYRMKQNAVGLANICILTTAVLIMLSATSSIAVGVDGIIKSQYDREMMTVVEEITKEQIPLVEEVIQKVCGQSGIEMSNVYIQQMHYLMLEYDGKCFKESLKNRFNFDDLSGVGLIPLDVYNTLEEQNEVLQPGEVLVYEQGNKLKGDSVKFGEDKFLIKKQLEEVKISKMFQSSIIQRYIFVVESEEVIQKIYQSLERKV
ncbi:MAG: ABC transporter permease, partial [Zhenhengia yiwuensis]|nr:ABC transporter permease [Zhenhengia yiwuensis]